MKLASATIAFLLSASSASAFSPTKLPKIPTAAKSSVTDQAKDTRPRFDPFGLYPKDAPERKDGRLQPLEPESTPDKTIKDPMNLYSSEAEVDDKPMSASVPFLKRPALLDGSLPGDRGFDPFNFASTPDALQWYRTAEVKHARLAMLAAVGWPLSELLDKKLAMAFNLKPLLDMSDRVPSVLNGGLDRTPLPYWAAVLGVAFAIETLGFLKEKSAFEAGGQYTPGDLGFDPLGLAGNTLEDRKWKAEAEIFNGRLAMLAITSFALQEWWFDNSIVNQFPIFFKPINVALEQLQDQVGNAM